MLQVAMKTKSQPVFIVGVLRSGTSLLHSLLNQHPGMALMYESDVWSFPRAFSALRFRHDWLERLELYNRCLSRHRLTWGGSRHGLESIRTPDDLYQTYAQLKPATVFGEKSPFYCARLEELNRRYPKAAFVIVWRDPVESYRSVVKAGQTSSFFGKPGMLSRLIYYQEQAIQQAARIEQGGARVFRVNYAELVAEPEKICRQLCAFLSLEFDPQMLRLAEADLSPVYKEPHHEFLRRGIIERQRYPQELVTPATVNKLSGYRTRWERLQSRWLGGGNPSARRQEPGWLERIMDASNGRLFNLYDDLVRLAFEFLPISWLLTHRRFKRWLLNTPLATASRRPDHASSIIVALVYLASLVFVHLHANPHLMFLPLYLLPCLALALLTNLRWATFFTFICAIIAPLVQGFNSAEYQSFSIMFWNSSMRFLLTELLVLLFVRIRTEINDGDESTARSGLPQRDNQPKLTL